MEQTEIIFREIYHKNYENVIRICMGYTKGNLDEAKDLAQEVFIKVWTGLEKFRKDSKISTWIYRITVNTCLMRLNKLKRKVSPQDIASSYNTVNEDTTLEKEKMYSDLYNCIDKLAPTNRAIILLELEGLPQKQIALIIGIKHEAIRTRIHRIKNELTKCVSHE